MAATQEPENDRPPRPGQVLVGLVMILICLILLFKGMARDPETGSASAAASAAAPPDTGTVLSAAEPSSPVTIIDTIRENESLQQSMRENGLPYQEVFLLTEAFNRKFDLRHSFPGHWYSVTVDTGQQLIRHFEYTYSSVGVWVMDRQGDGFRIREKKFHLDRVVSYLEGNIESSLWQAMTDLGIGWEMITKFTDIFDWDIDFLTETRQGDGFKLVYEEYLQEGRLIRYGKILAAQYKGESGNHIAIYFRDQEGHEDYYDLQGNSMRKLFTKSPLNYKRISSKFTLRRYHPILKIYRPHLGVDFAAPIGTEVRTVGDGTVLAAAWDEKGYGNYVKIRHPQGYETLYGHLRKIAPGVKKGRRVTQDQPIGWVGSSGLSTGPHLDYRVKRYGKYVDPLRMKLPVAKSVEPQYREGYHQHRDLMLEMLMVFPLS